MITIDRMVGPTLFFGLRHHHSEMSNNCTRFDRAALMPIPYPSLIEDAERKSDEVANSVGVGWRLPGLRFFSKMLSIDFDEIADQPFKRGLRLSPEII